MSVLQSLPAFPRASRKQTQRHALAPERFLTPTIRARAFQQIQGAVQRGTLKAGDVNTAMQQGISQVALLLQHHAAPIPLPLIDKTTLPRNASTQPLKKSTAAIIRAWLHSFLAAGDIDRQDVLKLDQERNPLELLMLFTEGWKQRVQRISDTLVPGPNTGESSYFRLMPGVVAEALNEITGNAIVYLEEGAEDLAKGLHLELTDYPIVPDPTDHRIDPGFHQAFHSAWHAVCEASGWHLAVPCGDMLECYMPGLDEALSDLSRTCDIRGEVVHFTSDAIDELQEEFGFDMSDEQVRTSISAHMIWRRSVARQKPWKPQSAAMKKWLSEGEGDKKRVLVNQLLDIAKAMRINRPEKRVYERHYTGSFHAAFGIMPSNTGIDDFLVAEIDGYANETEWTQSILLPATPNAEDLFRLAEQGVIEITLITRAFHHVQNYS